MQRAKSQAWLPRNARDLCPATCAVSNVRNLSTIVRQCTPPPTLNGLFVEETERDEHAENEGRGAERRRCCLSAPRISR